MDISRVILFTPDVGRLAGFYRTCFGLKEIGESDADWIELDAGGCGIAFHKISEDGGRDEGPLDSNLKARSLASITSIPPGVRTK
jgi:hypothetical protein